MIDWNVNWSHRLTWLGYWLLLLILISVIGIDLNACSLGQVFQIDEPTSISLISYSPRGHYPLFSML